MKLEHALKGITDLIVHTYHPEVILLFGSYAKEQDHADSDLDILIIGNFRESPYLRGREVMEQLRRYPISLDVLFYTKAEIDFELRKPFGFISSILRSSVILYEDNPSTTNLALRRKLGK